VSCGSDGVENRVETVVVDNEDCWVGVYSFVRFPHTVTSILALEGKKRRLSFPQSVVNRGKRRWPERMLDCCLKRVENEGKLRNSGSNRKLRKASVERNNSNKLIPFFVVEKSERSR